MVGDDAGQEAHDEADFDEEWYLARYPDIAAAVQKGGLKSGLAHYRAHGRREGRLPCHPDSQLFETLRDRHIGAGFLDPTDLQVTPLHPRRVLMIGACQMAQWGFHQENPSGCAVDLLTVGGLTDLPEMPQEWGAIADYDFQIIQLPLRYFIGDLRLPRLSLGDKVAFQEAFVDACARLKLFLDYQMRWNKEHGLLTFVANFFVPQGRTTGRLMPKYDLRNLPHFIYKLNEYLEDLTRSYRNCHILDIDEVSASLGRRYCQDDLLYSSTHNSLIEYSCELFDRIEPTASMQDHYVLAWLPDFPKAVWAEALSMFRSLRQADAVKMVVVDLDDTLWMGVAGEVEGPALDETTGLWIEGWPLGLAEALLYLRQRGILLGIISKNDEGRIGAIWPEVYDDSFPLNDFAITRINWRPKPENMCEILEAVNLLPRSVVFIDDNPAERAAMAAAFPEMRILGRNHYYLRRILAWSAETQPATITEESSARTTMVQSQVRREETRKTMTAAEFLTQVAPVVTLLSLGGPDHPRFARAFELLNKTNQFNTTGQRWTEQTCAAFFRDGGRMHTFEVADSFTRYGLVGVILVRGAVIEQWVMSCRVLGLGIETAVGARLVALLQAASPAGEPPGGIAGPIAARLLQTDVNFPCRDLYARLGFVRRGDLWELPAGQAPAVPGHVSIEGSLSP